MALDTATRLKAVHFFAQRAYKSLGGTAQLDSNEILAAVVALDDWFDAAPKKLFTETTNQAQILLALPTAFSNGSDASQKALLLSAVALGKARALP